jgi:hypothetical protein
MIAERQLFGPGPRNPYPEATLLVPEVLRDALAHEG